MKIVVDTNILFSFFRDNPVRFIILNAIELDLELFTPEHCWKELVNISPAISKYSKVSTEQIISIFEELKQFINIPPDESNKKFKEKAKYLSPHEKDIQLFALALSINASIWSNEPAFKRQSSIKIFNTEELRKLLEV